MKLTKLPYLATMGMTLALAATGCKTQQAKVTTLPSGRSGAADLASTQRPIGDGNVITPVLPPVDTTSSGIAQNGSGHPGWIQDPAALQGATTYFEFDKSAIRTSEESKLGDVASYLKSNTAKAVLVEGNCDDRGTEEYNRSLGERRALAAREYLVSQGIDAGRIDIVTYGEDKPAVPGNNESARSKNRRDEFVVLTQP